MRGLLVGVNAQRFGGFECGCFSRKCLNGTDYCLPAFARSVKGGFPPAEDPNVGPTLPLFALHASLLIPCSPRHVLSWIGATDGCFLAYRSARQRSSMFFSVAMFCEPGVSGCARSLDRQHVDSWECAGR